MAYTASHQDLKKDFEICQKIIQTNNVLLLNHLMDSTILKPQTSPRDIENLCAEAKESCFRSVCIPPCYVAQAFKALAQTDVKVCTVVGFPNGYNTSKSKIAETQQAIEEGATEIDFVQNISFAKEKNKSELEKEFIGIINAAQGNVVKIILETSLLSEDDIIFSTRLAAQCGVNIIKTSTGFGQRGATLSDIEIIQKVLIEHAEKTNIQLGIKASGGIGSLQDAIAFVQAGATRLGTSRAKNILLGEKNSSY